MKAFLLALLAVVLVHQYLRWAAAERPVKRCYTTRVDFPTKDHLDDFLADCTSEAPWVQYQDAMRRTRRPYRGHKHG